MAITNTHTVAAQEAIELAMTTTQTTAVQNPCWYTTTDIQKHHCTIALLADHYWHTNNWFKIGCWLAATDKQRIFLL